MEGGICTNETKGRVCSTCARRFALRCYSPPHAAEDVEYVDFICCTGEAYITSTAASTVRLRGSSTSSSSSSSSSSAVASRAGGLLAAFKRCRAAKEHEYRHSLTLHHFSFLTHIHPTQRR